MSRFFISSTTAVLALLTLSSLARGQTPKPQESFAGAAYVPAGAAVVTDLPPLQSGAFTQTVPLGVPTFRGLEPSIRLSYSSRNTQNGFVGVGWALEGIDTIERRDAVVKAPRFGASDSYVWNGEPLVLNSDLGGTHATKRQSFQRITLAGNVWTITAKDGTRRIYSPIVTTAKGTFRWGLSQVINLRDQKTTYEWYCEASECYPDKITYNGNTITFVREGRSDVERFATGAGVGKTLYRLQSVQVYSAGSLLRTYGITYGTNAVNKSRLAQVAQTGLPATTFTYPPDPAAPARFEAAVNGTSFGSPPVSYAAFTPQEGDFNGDGRTDYLLHYRQNYTIYTQVSLANADGSFAAPVGWSWGISPPFTASIDAWGLKFGDYNGDGRMDLALHINDAASNTFYFYLAFATTSGTFSGTALQSYSFGTSLPPGSCGTLNNNYELESADYTNDGVTDLRLHCRSGNPWGANGPSSAHSFVFRGTGAGSFYTPPVVSHWDVQTPGQYSLIYYGIQPGDYNGDGLLDVRFHSRTLGTTNSYVAFGNGAGGFGPLNLSTQTVPSPPFAGLEYYTLDSGDWNGDRKTDFRLAYRGASGMQMYTYLSTGNGGFTAVPWSYAGSPVTGDWRYYDDLGLTGLSGDYDGDGLGDLAFAYHNSGAYLYVASGNGDGTYQAPALMPSASGSYAGYFALSGDYNGDGRTDVRFAAWNGSSLYSTLMLASSKRGAPSLLQKIGHWTGGDTTATYNDHTSGKVLANVTNSDGNGGSVSHSYAFSEPYVRNDEEKTDIGFRQARVTDGLSDYTDVYWYQSPMMSSGTVERQKRYAASGGLMSEHYAHIDVSDASVPYTRFVDYTDETTCGGACVTVHTGFAYDGYGNVKSESVESGLRTRAFEYTNDVSLYLVGKPTKETVSGSLGGSLVTGMGYNSYGELTSKTVGGLLSLYGYDAMGNVASVTDPRNNTETTWYDNIYPIRTVNRAGHETTQTWDKVCQVQRSATDANGTTTYDYDMLCRKKLETRPDSSWTSISYNSFGTPGSQHVYVATSDGTADGLYARSYFDGLGRTWKEERESAATTIVGFDQAGHIARRTVDGAATTFTYDALGRMRVTTLPGGATVQQSYDGLDVTTTDERGFAVTRTHNALGAVTRMRDSVGTTDIGRDSLGRMTGITDPLNYKWTFGYDAAGRRDRLTDPDTGSWTFGFDGNGSTAWHIDGRGVRVDYDHDALNRLTAKRSGGQTLATFTYDTAPEGYPQGRLAFVTDSTGTTGYFYDRSGRATQEYRTIAGRFYNIWRTYDAAGRPATLTYPDGETIGYSYDAGGRLVRAGNYAHSGSYDVRGQLKARSLCSMGETFTYDTSRGWLTSWSTAGVQSLIFGHDAAGNVKSVTGGPSDWGFDYDALGRMTSSTGPYAQTFDYDPNGRMSAQTGVGAYSYSLRAHAPVSVNGGIMNYDGNGNLTSGAGHSYTYDAENLVSSVDGVAVKYNGQGERVMAGNTRYVGDLYEDDGVAPKKYYYFGKSRVARRDASGVSYYHSDQVGSVTKITSGSGAVKKTQTLSPFGHQVGSPTGTLIDDFGLAGQHRQNGVYAMGARYMDPELAMFTSPDVSGDPDPSVSNRLNRYAYAYQNPSRFIDPTGYAGEEPEQRYQPPGTCSDSDPTPCAPMPSFMDRALASQEQHIEITKGIVIGEGAGQLLGAAVRAVGRWIGSTSEPITLGIGRILPDEQIIYHGTTTARLPADATELLPKTITGVESLNADTATIAAEAPFVFATTSKHLARTYAFINESTFGGRGLVVEIRAEGFSQATSVINTGEAGTLHPRAFASQRTPRILKRHNVLDF